MIASIGGLLSQTGRPCPTRAETAAELAALPPLGSMVGDEEIKCFAQNADLIPDDYASLLGSLYGATNSGKRSKLVLYGIGAACGLALGVVVGKYVL